MTQDPNILPNILIVVFFALAMVPVYLMGRRAGHAIKRRMAIRRRLDEPETYGDDGGRPEPLYDMTPCKPDTPAPDATRAEGWPYDAHKAMRGK